MKIEKTTHVVKSFGDETNIGWSNLFVRFRPSLAQKFAENSKISDPEAYGMESRAWNLGPGT
jgi:hypothetical protein